VAQPPNKESQQQEPPAADTAVAASAVQEDEALTRQLRRTSELTAAGRLPEAEAALLAAKKNAARDLRVLKLLALVRFKLGRLGEAREAYREAAEVAPDDATVRLNLGLVALKLELFAEAASELETAVRLVPDDRRAWSYLGYAYAKSGARMQAATAFRRAGQHELAAEMERAATPPSQVAGSPEVQEPQPATGTATEGETSVASGMATPRPLLRQTPVPVLKAEAFVGDQVATLANFTTGHLLALAPSQVPLEVLGRGLLRFTAGAETHVRESALLAALGAEGLALARRRVRGQLSDEKLTHDGDRFFRVEGTGELLLASPDRERGLVALSLDRDVLYLEEARVVAWGDEIVWESGSVPGNGTPLVQFRGTGRVVILAGQGEIVAVRIAEGESMAVPSARLAGWLGRIVVQARPTGEATGIHHLSCEGEGVLLISKHGEPR
jgi:tetratricopeptide (TPR) repeat protein